jgi:phage-related protein
VKQIVFLGDSLDRLRDFPETVRREAGYQLERVQRGLEPDDWKPMSSVGAGAREIRVRERSGAYRVIYVATYRGAVYVLHAFPKKAQRTPLRDIELAGSRLEELKRRAQ